MIHIFTSKITPRVEFAFQLIFKIILNEEVDFHSNELAFSEIDGIKLNYSNNMNLDGLSIKPVSLLFETDIREQKLVFSDWEETNGPFKIDQSIVPFDVFAASFFFATRYEEYLPSPLDKHDRFLPENSILTQKSLLEKPIINIWANKLADIIENNHPEFRFNRSKFEYCPTIDIDNAWAYQHKGVFRTILSTLKDVAKRDWHGLGNRYSVFLRHKKDPFDNYDFLLDLFEEYQMQPKFFFLLNYKGKEDKSISYKNIHFRNLIRTISDRYTVGIHPSYASNKKDDQLKKEINRLQTIITKPVELSRQHFLKLNFPSTYARLIGQGIVADYTLGYASLLGFRAGIATPYPFFDLQENRTTNLTLYPFQVMDVTLAQYQKLSPEEAISTIKKLMAETHQVGGLFVSLWHNESLSNEGNWKGWRKVYTEMTQLAAELIHEQ
jgi:hypothetical protein